MIQYGLTNELIDDYAPVEYAIDVINSDPEQPIDLLEIAGARKGEPATSLVDRLADAEPACDEKTMREKWLYLVLSWIYENRSQFSDPLRLVEEVYSDFGYPDEISSFVRYMPMTGVDLGSRMANENRLYDRWLSYIVDRERRFK